MTRASFDFVPAARADAARPAVVICDSDIPLAPAIAAGRAALAVITGVDGASYRPVGAVMAIDAAGRCWGSLSSGCIERDVALHAQAALADGQARRLRYGKGSPFRDLVLPCGGGLDVLVLPLADGAHVQAAAERLRMRQTATLCLTDATGHGITLHIRPQPRLVVFGKGPEARCFAGLAAAAGYPVQVFSPEEQTVAGLAEGHLLATPCWPEGLALDHRSAVALFFHDHDWEPPLLKSALESPAFYVGAQGSLRAHRERCRALLALGLSDAVIGRLASPFGAVASARDPRMLAVSVLAQVLDRARLA